MKANFKFPLTVNKRSVEFPNSTAMRISICNAPGNQNRGRTRCSDLSHKQKKTPPPTDWKRRQGLVLLKIVREVL